MLTVAETPNGRSIAVMGRIGLKLDHRAELADDTGTLVAAVCAADRQGFHAATRR